MKKVTSSNIMKKLKIALIFLYIIGVVIIGIYPFDNQEVTVNIKTDEGTNSIKLDADIIAAGGEYAVSYPGIQNTVIKEITLSRKYKSIYVDKIQSDHVSWYTRIEQDQLVLTSDMLEMLQDISESFIMERIIYAEILLAIVIFLWIVLNAIQEKGSRENSNNHGPIYEIGRFVRDIKKYWTYMVYAAKADLKAEVANSYLNRLWWLLEPFFSMLVYVIVFGRMMGSSIENYATYVFSALLMWNFFSKTINYSVKCVRNNRDIITKVYVPKHVLLISNMILNFYKLIFSLIVLIPMLFIFKVHIGIEILGVIPAYILMMLLSFGVGMIFLHYGVYIDDLGYAVGILLQMLMFLSGIFYDVILSLLAPLNVMMLSLNPVAIFVDAMRNALLNRAIMDVPLVIIWTILSLLISYVGVHIVYKNENGYVKVV